MDIWTDKARTIGSSFGEHKKWRRGEGVQGHAILYWCACSHLSDADLCLCVLETLLDDAEQGSWGDQCPVDVRLTDVGLHTECVRRVHKSW